MKTMVNGRFANNFWEFGFELAPEDSAATFDPSVSFADSDR